MIDDTDKVLLESLLDGPKYLHMGRSPVEAIKRVFGYIDKGLVTMVENYVSLTHEGRKLIAPNMPTEDDDYNNSYQVGYWDNEIT